MLFQVIKDTSYICPALSAVLALVYIIVHQQSAQVNTPSCSKVLVSIVFTLLEKTFLG